jgi:drug/metabolite transporter (DMT)-like permease
MNQANDHARTLALAAACVLLSLERGVPAIAFESLAVRWTPESLATMTWLIFAVSLGAYGLMWRLLENMDATRLASLFYLGPPVTMVMGWLAFGDRLQPTDLAGLLIAGLGVALVYRTAAGPAP